MGQATMESGEEKKRGKGKEELGLGLERAGNEGIEGSNNEVIAPTPQSGSRVKEERGEERRKKKKLLKPNSTKRCGVIEWEAQERKTKHKRTTVEKKKNDRRTNT
jgi:hypothetical protein